MHKSEGTWVGYNDAVAFDIDGHEQVQVLNVFDWNLNNDFFFPAKKQLLIVIYDGSFSKILWWNS